MVSNVVLYLAMRGLNGGQRMDNPRTVKAVASAPADVRQRAEALIQEKYADDPVLLQITSAYDAMTPMAKRGSDWTTASLEFAKGNGVEALRILPLPRTLTWATSAVRENRAEPELAERFDPEAASANVRALIQQGEHERLEFKATLRWDLRRQAKSDAMTQEVLKTICAFLNTWGGGLLVGVADDGTVLGIESDQFGTDDRCGQFFAQLVKDRIGPEFIPFIRSYFVALDGKSVLVVSCTKAGKWAVVNKDGFYVRNGNTTLKLDVKQVLEYIEHRKAA